MPHFIFSRRKPQAFNRDRCAGDVPANERTSPASLFDGLAIGASAACLVHCLLLPILLAAIPAASRALKLPEELHIFAFAAAIPISALAMKGGYRHHGLLLPAGMGLLGLFLLGVGALAHLEGMMETGFSLAGSIVLMLAHVRNWQLRSRRPPRP